MESKALVWFTNNLRATDNTALFDALKENNTTVAIYFFDPRHYKDSVFGFKKTERFRARFLLESILNLQENLKKLNIPLLVIQGKPENHLPKIVANHSISKIYHLEEWTKEETDIINSCKKAISKDIIWKSYYDQFLFQPDDLPFSIESTPKVFTDFRKKIERYSSIRPEKISVPTTPNNYIPTNKPLPTIENLGLQDFQQDSRSAFPFKGGEDEALKRMHSYFWKTKSLSHYKETRNGLVGIDYSSKFSPWLANGSLSPKTIYHQIKAFEAQYGANDSTYWLIFELIWRDFFKYVSMKHGASFFKLNGILQKEYEWNTNEKNIQKWINGQTEEPFVNANMLEIKHTGWMSNRGRQNVASYFAKTLKMDWRIGAAYFESMLLDYDVHSNYGNWQYVAGVGNDPRDRMFNIKLQAERYDLKGIFQNMWLQPKSVS